MPALGQSLKLANENPARKLEVKLATGEADGTLDASIAVADERAWKATLNLDAERAGPVAKPEAGQ